ncbi:MAG: L-serine dehydratase [Bacillota bacterium]|nr:MAG: L-serine dehydratase [Bacillota bacterium]
MTNILDIIGPIMIGPSSSHTAGAARLGKLALRILQERVVSAEILLYGSFARTYVGHGTHLAVLGGLLGFDPDDTRIREADKLAKDEFTFDLVTLPEETVSHPNTVRLRLRGEREQLEMVGISVGGGRVIVTEIDRFAVHIDGESTILVIHSLDQPGVITKLTALIAEDSVNIGNMNVSRQSKGASVVMTIEIDSPISPSMLLRLKAVAGVSKITQIIP